MTSEVRQLFVPGPTPLSAAVLEAHGRPLPYHRGPDFSMLVERTIRRLGGLLGATDSDVFVLPSSGTGALECALTNVVLPGEAVVVATNGQFGDRLASMATDLGCDVRVVRAAWGQRVRPAAVAEALTPDVVALCVVDYETSTGVRNDVAALAALCRDRSTVVVVDAVSSLGAFPFAMDAWGVDVVASSSQKGLGGAPGIGIVAVSPKAWRAKSERRPLVHYFDWDRMRAAQSRRQPETVWTPPVGVMLGLDAALEELEAEGAARQLTADATRRRALEGFRLLGFEELSPAEAAGPVLVLRPPSGVDAEAFRGGIADAGIDIAGCQGELKESWLRVALYGRGVDEVEALLGVVEDVLQSLGHGPVATGDPLECSAMADRIGECLGIDVDERVVELAVALSTSDMSDASAERVRSILDRTRLRARWNAALDAARAAALADDLCHVIEPDGGPVLDVLSGTGTVAAALRARGFDVVELEHLSHYPGRAPGPELRDLDSGFDAEALRSRGFQAALVVTVLHHEPAPAALLDQLVELALPRYIVAENVHGPRATGTFHAVFDWFFNCCLNDFGVGCPGLYWTKDEWLRVLSSLGSVEWLFERSRVPGIPFPYDYFEVRAASPAAGRESLAVGGGSGR